MFYIVCSAVREKYPDDSYTGFISKSPISNLPQKRKKVRSNSTRQEHFSVMDWLDSMEDGEHNVNFDIEGIEETPSRRGMRANSTDSRSTAEREKAESTKAARGGLAEITGATGGEISESIRTDEGGISDSERADEGGISDSTRTDEGGISDGNRADLGGMNDVISAKRLKNER